VTATVLLVCHVNPDGDALGSMLGFGLGLRQLGFAPLATFPAPFELAPPFDALPGRDLLIDPAGAPAAPDLLICFDAASEGRLGELANRLEHAGTSLVLDHHASNTRFGDLPVVEPTAAATSVVAEALLARLGVRLDAAIAECLYVALATDTGSFKFDLTTPAVHELAARLLATGIRPAEISRRLFDSRPFGAMKLYGDVLARAVLEPAEAGGGGLVWSYATLDDLARHGPAAQRAGRADRRASGRRGGGRRVRVQAGRHLGVVGVGAQQGRRGRGPARGRPGRRRAPVGGRVHRVRNAGGGRRVGPLGAVMGAHRNPPR